MSVSAEERPSRAPAGHPAPADLDRFALGGRLRLARTQAGVTLEEVAREAGMTPGHLSRLERGEKMPSIGALVRLAKALGTTVVALMGGDPAEGELVIARAADRTTLGGGNGAARYEILLRGATCGGQSATAFIVNPDPEAGTVGDASHQGLEFVFVLNGMIEIVFAERVVTLGNGDVMLFPGYLRHRIRRHSAAPASALVVMVGA